jgi:hypothetical protein
MVIEEQGRQDGHTHRATHRGLQTHAPPQHTQAHAHTHLVAPDVEPAQLGADPMAQRLQHRQGPIAVDAVARQHQPPQPREPALWVRICMAMWAWV